MTILTGTEAGHETIPSYIVPYDLILWFAYLLLMHGTGYNFKKLFSGPTYIQPRSNNNTILQGSRYTTDSACLCDPMVTPNIPAVSSNLNTSVSANPRQSFDRTFSFGILETALVTSVYTDLQMKPHPSLSRSWSWLTGKFERRLFRTK